MYKPRVYVETTIPSFYHTDRRANFALARRKWTRRWWDGAAEFYELITSSAVLNEPRRGDYPTREAALALVEPLPRLRTSPAIKEIVATYVRHRLMTADPLGDALHLALASYHRCDFLVTWNCHHLANANKFKHIRRVNTQLGLYVPTLVTPLELLGGDDEEDD